MIQVLSYEDVRELLAGDDRLHEFILGYFDGVMRANPAIDPELAAAMKAGAELALLNVDGDAHHRLRAAVSRAFTPRSVTLLRPELNRLANDLAAQLVSGQDFVASFARELPARALCLLTGIPGEDHERFAAWIDAHEPCDGRVVQVCVVGGKPGNQVVVRYFAPGFNQRKGVGGHLAMRREQCFRLLTGHPQQVDLIFAGNDTTRKALASMVLTLSELPDVWETVAHDPGVGPAVVDETLRLYGPAPGPIRRAVRDFTHKGGSFSEGLVAALSIWSANRDETFWGEDASTFDPGRANLGQHLSFGHGPHFCLGASLAREEMLAALLALTSQITSVRVLEAPAMPPVGSVTDLCRSGLHSNVVNDARPALAR